MGNEVIEDNSVMDPHFTVEVVSQMSNPQQTIYAALHQDYSEDFVWDKRDRFPSESESGVIAINKLLKGGRGHWGCYSADTEVLTENGWKFWPAVTEQDSLLAVDVANNSCAFEKPAKLQAIQVSENEKLYSVQSQYLNFQVTLDHRMVVSHKQTSGKFSEWYFKRADEVIGKPVRYLLSSNLDDRCRFAEELPEGVDPYVAFKLAGFFFGDGLRTPNKEPEAIRFRLRRANKINYLMGLGLSVTLNKGDRYTISHGSLAQWIHGWFSNSSGKTVPLWLLTLPKDLLEAFWDGLRNSDGTRITNKSWCYDCSDKEALDIIQATAHINGLSANMTLNNPNDGPGHENHRPGWRLCFNNTLTKRVETCQKTRSPGVTEKVIDYQGKVYCATVSTGALMVRRANKVLVCGNCLEHTQIVLNCGWFPHSTMQQIRTHRHLSFDVQSGRYTGRRICDVITGKRDVEKVFYLRPPGEYTDRRGKKYTYTADDFYDDKLWCLDACKRYKEKIDRGFAEEHARGTIPFDVRQHWVVSANMRALVHLLTIRGKPDAQLECVQFCELVLPHFKAWAPEIYEYFEAKQWKKGRLAP